MPTQTDRLTQLRENCEEGTLPYISKSRLTTYKTCPRKFFYQYIRGLRPPENDAMKRGTRIHETFEIYYENLLEAYEETGDIAMPLRQYLPEDTGKWADFTVPYISNFLLFEHRRLDASWDSAARTNAHIEEPSATVEEAATEQFLPLGIEAEGWDETMDPVWMGYADAILYAGTIPQVESDTGAVIVDFKTGKTPDEKYRNDGIFLEGEYYAMLFEKEWEVAAVSGYYPKNDDFIISELDAERREDITQMVNEMKSSQDIEDFPIDPQPLCKWGDGDDEQCDFYNVCPSSWGERGGPGPSYD